MSWIALTKDTLYEAKVAALIDACDAAALGAGQAHRAAGIIQGVVNEIRNAVATCLHNRVDDDVTKIPVSQRDLAVDLVLARLKSAILQDLTPDERDNVAERRRQLRDIAAGALVVDQPDLPVMPPVQQGGAVQIVQQQARPVTGEQLGHL